MTAKKPGAKKTPASTKPAMRKPAAKRPAAQKPAAKKVTATKTAARRRTKANHNALGYDMEEATAYLHAADPKLAAVIDLAGPCTLAPDPLHDMFSYLVRSIIFQQLNGTAARTIHNRFLDLWPEDGHPSPEQILEADAEYLRTAGISGNKAKALHDLADHMVRGVLPTVEQAYDLPDDELVKLLTDVRGIGPWTVHMLMMFRLGRPDVLPTGDFGVCNGYAITYGLDKHPTPTQLKKATEHWKPYRTVASWYMWRAADMPKERSAELR